MSELGELSKLSIVKLTEICETATMNYCNDLLISAGQIYGDEAVMYYLGHPTANPAQWHEEWCKLRKKDLDGSEKQAVKFRKHADLDPRIKPLAELDELEQIKYVVFLNMFRTLRQLL